MCLLEARFTNLYCNIKSAGKTHLNNYAFMLVDSGYSMDVELIPYTLTGEECPSNGNYIETKLNEVFPIMQVCLCEDHCAWHMCNLVHPPKGCLEKNPSEWHWDGRMNTYIAQVVLGNKFLLLVHNRITNLYSNSSPDF